MEMQLNCCPIDESFADLILNIFRSKETRFSVLQFLAHEFTNVVRRIDNREKNYKKGRLYKIRKNNLKRNDQNILNLN